MARAPPEPSTALEEAVSGVAVTHPSPTPGPAVEGLRLQPAPPPTEFPGLTNSGWLRTLKTSARNCAVRRSLNLNDFVTEKSMFRKFGPRNGRRGKLPVS